MRIEKNDTEVTTTTMSIEDLMKQSSTGPLPIGDIEDEPKEVKPEGDEQEEDIKKEEPAPKLEVEEKQDEVKKEDYVKEESDLSQTFKDTLTLMYGENFLTETAVGDESDNIVLADIEITPEILRDVIQTMTDDKLVEATEEMVSLKGVDGQFKDLLEIAKNGGNIQELIRIKVEIEDQVNSLDLDNKADQQSVIVLAKSMEGFSDKDIARYIKGLEGEDIYEVARESKSRILTVVKNHRENEKRRAQEEVDRKVEISKNFKKELSKNISERLDVSDSYKRKLVDIATKADENGSVEIDELYKAAKHDPTQAPELILFLTDREEFNKQVSRSEVIEAKKSSIRLIRKASQDKGGNLQQRTYRKEDKEETISLENLKI